MGFSLLLPLVALPGLWAGSDFVFSLPLCGHGFSLVGLLVGLFVGSGLMFGGLCVLVVGFSSFVGGNCSPYFWCLFRAVALSYVFRGGVIFSGPLWILVLFLGLCPFW